MPSCVVWKVRVLGFLLVVLDTGALAKLYFVEPKDPLRGKPAPPGSPWPEPRIRHTSRVERILEPRNFVLSSEQSESCDIIPKSLERYRKLIFAGGSSTVSQIGNGSSLLPALRVVVGNARDCGHPQQGDIEDYSLEIPFEGDARLYAARVWGALRGLETFSQLVHWDNSRMAFVVNSTRIFDYPAYTYRGVLLDSARHFLPVKLIKQNLDAMSYNKFNVFHWHLVDDQSWPLEMAVYPNLTNGAYSPKHVYTRRDVQDVIAYAREIGIRVIPEIDSPGHTHALGKAFPDILTPCYGRQGRGTAKNPLHAAFENLDPTNDNAYHVMTNIFREVVATFRDEYIHLGMDEAYQECWKSSPEIKKFMDELGYRSTSELEGHYVRKTLANVKRLGSKYIVWQDPVQHGIEVAKDALVQIWVGSSRNEWWQHARDVTRKGYRIIVSAPWYLNYISYGQDWEKYYTSDPRSFADTQEQEELVVGGEVCMWGEYVDATNLLSRLWPRASAAAERLWSSPKLKNTDQARFRLDQHRCRMLARGIPAQPVLNGYCGDEDWQLEA